MNSKKNEKHDMRSEIEELIKEYPKYLNMCRVMKKTCEDASYHTFVPAMSSVINGYACSHGKDTEEVLADITKNLLMGINIDAVIKEEDDDEDDD